MNNKTEFLGHPKGLAILFLTEMWERFSFYGIKAILVLYMVNAVMNGGFGWEEASALSILGVFQMFCYLTGIPGGMIADKWLGARRSVWFGCLFISLGNFLLFFPMKATFFAGLTGIALGGGLLKPNITTLVGRLYERTDPRREAAFTIFYQGINVGSFFSGIVVGFIAMKWGWRYGFLASAIGMFFGQGVYVWGQRYLRHTDLVISAAGNRRVAESAPLTKAEWRRIAVVLFSFLSVIIFWTAYEQSGGLLTLYTEKFTDRTLGSFTIPTPWFHSLNPLMIVTLAPLAAALWTYLGRKKKDPNAVVKMGLGTVIQGLGYLTMVAAVFQRDASATGQSSMLWIFGVYFFCTVGELALSPVANSFITSMAPERMTSQMMGWYFAVTGVAGYLASRVGSFSTSYGERTVFIGLVIVTTAIGLIQLAFAKKIISFGEKK